MHAQHDIFDPAEVLEPGFAVGSEPVADPVGPVEGQEFDGFFPGGGRAALLEGQDVFPAKLLAGRQDGLAGVKGVGDQAEGQFGKLLFEPLTQAREALEFAVLLFGLRVMQVHFFMQEREEGAGGPQHGELKDIAVAGAAAGRLAALGKAAAAFFLHAAIEHQDIPVLEASHAIEEAALQEVAEHQHRDLRHQLGVHPGKTAKESETHGSPA